MNKSETTLTEATVLKKSKASNLADVHNLNLWGLNLGDISFIVNVPNVETIALSVNSVRTLKPFAECSHLRELFLRKNKISSFEELFHLQKLENLTVLWLSENPITEQNDYRNLVIAILPKLTKLDQQDITPEEKEQALKKYPDPRSVFQPVKHESHKSVRAEPTGSQQRILNAINILLPELDEDTLEVLYDTVQQYKQRK